VPIVPKGSLLEQMGEENQMWSDAYSQFTWKRPLKLRAVNAFPAWLVGLEFNVPFQHNYDYMRDERSGLESYPYPLPSEGRLATY